MTNKDKQWAEGIVARVQAAAERISCGEQAERSRRSKATALASIARSVAKHKPDGDALEAVNRIVMVIATIQEVKA